MSTPHHSLTLSFQARAALPACPPLAVYLLNLMSIKRSNLCLSADVTSSSELLQLAEELGDLICVLKTHADIIDDFSDRTSHLLKDIASRKHFLVFEDRKFADIGSTVQKQYTSGPLAIAKWAEIVTVHVFPGPSIVTALEQAATVAISQYNTTVHTEISVGSAAEDDPSSPSSQHGHTFPFTPISRSTSDTHPGSSSHGLLTSARDIRKQSIVSISTTISTRSEPMSPPPSVSIFSPGFPKPELAEKALARLGPIPYLRSALVLAQMSSEGNFFTPEYTKNCVNVARQHRDFTIGFITQQSLNSMPEDNFLIFTPGVQLGSEGKSINSGDGLGQQYRTPDKVIRQDGADVVIVGRGILSAPDRRAMAEKYRREAWDAYETRIGTNS
jgi:uridine monophosphate synthetase